MENIQTQTAQSIADRVNTSSDSATTIDALVLRGESYDLRVCGVGANAYFEWVNELGDAVGGTFSEISGIGQAKLDFRDNVLAQPLSKMSAY